MSEAPVIRIAVPNPYFEGATNVYLIAGDPVTLVDTGIGQEEAFIALEAGLRSHGFALGSIQRIVLTHHHLDHIGLACRIQERSGAEVFVHTDDWEAVAHFESWHDRFIDETRRYLTVWGVPPATIASGTSLMEHGGKRLAQATPAERLLDSQRLPMGPGELEVRHTAGHSPGSVCLRYGRFLFSGDHVLPDVSPNIGGGGLKIPGLLQRYLDSLDRVQALQDDDLLVFPGHGLPFSDLRGRIKQLKEHHRQRENAIVDLLRAGAPKTVYELARMLFGDLDGHHVVLGTAEAHVHLEKLRVDGRVTEEGGRYSATS
jgi:hydroxyacylglutathione hydrolase